MVDGQRWRYNIRRILCDLAKLAYSGVINIDKGYLIWIKKSLQQIV